MSFIHLSINAWIACSFSVSNVLGTCMYKSLWNPAFDYFGYILGIVPVRGNSMPFYVPTSSFNYSTLITVISFLKSYIHLGLERKWLSVFKHLLFLYRIWVWFPELISSGTEPPITPAPRDLTWLLTSVATHMHICTYMHILLK